jgi:hypothetical protein
MGNFFFIWGRYSFFWENFPFFLGNFSFFGNVFNICLKNLGIYTVVVVEIAVNEISH